MTDLTALAEGKWPHALTPGLSAILGTMCFQTISITACYRMDGCEIEHAAEAEQAFTLHRMLAHWFAHGDEGWRASFTEELRGMHSRVKAARAQAHSDAA